MLKILCLCKGISEGLVKLLAYPCLIINTAKLSKRFTSRLEDSCENIRMADLEGKEEEKISKSSATETEIKKKRGRPKKGTGKDNADTDQGSLDKYLSEKKSEEIFQSSNKTLRSPTGKNQEKKSVGTGKEAEHENSINKDEISSSVMNINQGLDALEVEKEIGADESKTLGVQTEITMTDIENIIRVLVTKDLEEKREKWNDDKVKMADKINSMTLTITELEKKLEAERRHREKLEQEIGEIRVELGIRDEQQVNRYCERVNKNSKNTQENGLIAKNTELTSMITEEEVAHGIERGSCLLVKPTAMKQGEWEFEESVRRTRKRHILIKGVRTVGKNLKADMEKVIKKCIGKQVRLISARPLGGGVLVATDSMFTKKEIMKRKAQIGKLGIIVEDDLTER